MNRFPTWKIIVVAIVCAFGILYTLPNFVGKSALSGLPDWMPTKQVNLGLDLQGGSHLLLQIDADTVKTKMMDSLVDGVRDSLRQQGDNVGYRDLGHDGEVVSFTLRDPADEEKARERLSDLSNIMANGQRDVVIASDEGRVTLTPSESAITARLSAAVDQSIEIVRRRVDETGVNEPAIQRQGTDRILVQLPGIDDPDRIKRLLGETAQLTFHLVDLTSDVGAAGRVPPGSKRLPSIQEDGRTYIIKSRTMVSGENLEDAQATFQQGQPVVSIRFDGLGAKQFGRATTDNVGKPFAIVLDNKVVSAPRINEPILGGSAVISGGFNVAGAQDLALLLRAGALPAPLDILEERSVGPDLGADSIAAGEIAGIIGIIAVAVFMIASYGLFGIFANVALAMNIFLIMAVLSVLGATLTLPGIAGIVLTIGMAVDANVLIFERIREEIRVGKTPLNAVNSGFARAFTTIIDANVTTGIAAVILFVMGSGPVKGFAVTLLIGIISSMFTAIMLSRMLISFWMQRKRPKTLEI
ncbi:protein translocase subunit SecD [Sneathiella sp. HT1-7]|jgi:protein-export membrane protein SecD|uniref:protein translocase subunit SecD n=1 Tax=Sneathiella sp. HT1-7 TaxID=2887192 RepID=UPI001D14A2F1|nr:protein translocase subunit SecD [Sneathiella sp. HT1-7]MCC3305007.1 protein translocase subunit SecD [Sneathiella sp. HT1-7]